MKKIIWLLALVMLSSIVLGVNPVIDAWRINPCVSGDWKNGTDLEIRITVSDDDGDDVKARATIYVGTSDEFDITYGVWQSSGTEFIFDTNDFKGRTNATIDDGLIQLRPISDGAGDIFAPIDIPFSVAVEGNEYGDCYSTALPTTETNVTTGEDAISSTMKAVNEESEGTFFSNMGSTVLWILLMLIVSAFIWFSCGEKQSSAITLGIIALVNFFLLMIGTYMGYISFVVIGIIIIIGGVWAGINIKKQFFS